MPGTYNLFISHSWVYGDASYSTWIQREIRIAKNSFTSTKPILAIKPWGNTNVSQVVASSAVRIVNWNTDSIVNAIRGLT